MTETTFSKDIDKLIPSLIKFRDVLVQPTKDMDNPFFSTASKKVKYAGLDSVFEAINTAMKQCNMTFLQPTSYNDGKFFVESIAVHESGQFIKSTYIVDVGEIVEEKIRKVANTDAVLKFTNTITAQQRGAALTYARRYAACSLLGIVADEDDDGNAASGNVKKETAPVIKPATPEETEKYKNYKAAIKDCKTLEELQAFWGGANKNIAKLPPDLAADLTAVKEQTKTNLGG
jgi:hypothetical protein